MGEGQDGPSGDPFEQLLDPGFVTGAAHREPSAEERRRAAEREARAADLKRRLAAEDAQRRVEERANRRSGRRARRKDKAKKVLAFGLLAVVVGGAVWYESRSDGPGGAPPQASARPKDYPPVDKSASKKPLATPPPAPPSPGGFEFMATQKVGTGPVAWDPCRPVRYVVNPAGAPPEGDQLIQEAALRTAVPAGLKFVNEGTTTEPWTKDREPYQPDRYGKKWAPVLIAWSTEAQSSQVAGYIAGRGGPIIRGGPDGRMASVSGSVILDAEDIAQVLTYPEGQAKARAIIQHELGHLVGLDHTSDSSQLMYSENTEQQTGDWGSGDLAGLHQLGKGGCFPDL